MTDQGFGNSTASTTDVVTEQVRQGKQDLVQNAQGALQTAQQGAQTVAEKQKGQAADSLKTVSGALRSTSDSLRQQQQGAVAGIADTAASKIDGVASYLENSDVTGLLQDAQQYARQNPGLVLGGAFALGLLAARFLKSSSQPSGGSGGSNYYGGSPYGGQYGAYSGGQYGSYSGQYGSYGGQYAGYGGQYTDATTFPPTSDYKPASEMEVSDGTTGGSY